MPDSASHSRIGVILGILNVVVVLLVGVALWVAVLGNRAVSSRTLDAQKRTECSAAGFRLYPDLLTNPVHLQKYVFWTAECNKLNNVRSPSVRLPPAVP